MRRVKKISCPFPELLLVLISMLAIQARVLSSPLTNQELSEIVKNEGEDEAISRLHSQTSGSMVSYLQMLKSGDVFGAAKASLLDEGQSEANLRSLLEQVYRVSTMATWDVISGWPFFTEDGTPGFVYKIKVSYQDSYYFVLSGVIIKDDKLWIVGSMAPESSWPEGFRTPSVPSPEKFALGVVGGR